MNFTSSPAIESPIRTLLFITNANTLGIDANELIDLTFDALETDKMHPYDALPDRGDNPEIAARTTMIQIMHALIGSDDDYDDARHDLEHALNCIELCEHGNCTTCCEPCLD